MVFTRTRRTKSFRTEITFEWTFAGMDANVCDHVMFESHSCITMWTNKKTIFIPFYFIFFLCFFKTL